MRYQFEKLFRYAIFHTQYRIYSENRMERRELFKAAAAITLAGLASPAIAESHEHMHHHHASNPYAKLIETTGDCIEKGNLCLTHCILLLSDGKSEMAACAKSVRQMLAICTALQQLATQEAPHVKDLAKLATTICKECEDECKKHADEHQACKECLESCKACKNECNSIA